MSEQKHKLLEVKDLKVSLDVYKRQEEAPERKSTDHRCRRSWCTCGNVSGSGLSLIHISVGALITMLGTFYTGYKGNKIKS